MDNKEQLNEEELERMRIAYDNEDGWIESQRNVSSKIEFWLDARLLFRNLTTLKEENERLKKEIERTAEWHDDKDKEADHERVSLAVGEIEQEYQTKIQALQSALREMVTILETARETPMGFVNWRKAKQAIENAEKLCDRLKDKTNIFISSSN